jgi:hypothetical protein
MEKTKTEIVLAIESRLKEREKRDTIRSLKVVPKITRKQLVRIANRLKRIFDQQFDIGVIELKVLRASFKSSVTLDELEQLVAKTGKIYAEKCGTIDKMLSKFAKEANRINRTKNNPDTWLKKLVNGFNKTSSAKVATVG